MTKVELEISKPLVFTQGPPFVYRYGYSFLLYVSGFITTEFAGTSAIFLHISWTQLEIIRESCSKRKYTVSKIFEAVTRLSVIPLGISGWEFFENLDASLVKEGAFGFIELKWGLGNWEKVKFELRGRINSGITPCRSLYKLCKRVFWKANFFFHSSWFLLGCC